MNRGKAAPQVFLSERQKSILVSYCNKRNISVQEKQRIGIILQAHAGKSDLAISRGLQITPGTVSRWRNRWVNSYEQLREFEQSSIEGSNRELLAKMLEILSDHFRSGAPMRISLKEKQQLVALACKEPRDFGIPITQWNREMLAKVAMAEGMIEKISPRYVSEILKKPCAPTS